MSWHAGEASEILDAVEEQRQRQSHGKLTAACIIAPLGEPNRDSPTVSRGGPARGFPPVCTAAEERGLNAGGGKFNSFAAKRTWIRDTPIFQSRSLPTPRLLANMWQLLRLPASLPRDCIFIFIVTDFCAFIDSTVACNEYFLPLTFYHFLFFNGCRHLLKST